MRERLFFGRGGGVEVCGEKEEGTNLCHFSLFPGNKTKQNKRKEGHTRR